jgi:hypothetical protein
LFSYFSTRAAHDAAHPPIQLGRTTLVHLAEG